MINAETEKRAVEILKQYHLWDKTECWVNYGDNESNFSVIGNQQSASDRALVEKITNAIDAMLVKECWKQGIDPESASAPESLEKALESFFGIRDGALSNINRTDVKKLSDNIQIVATGLRTKPSIAIIDKGEGQTPDNMPDTFLSLLKSNKMRIKFVMGSYNQGSTGALKFCGDENMNLIVTKRCPEIADNSDPSHEFWGFTIIRKFPPIGLMRNVVYKYLIIDGLIPRFKAKSLNLLPSTKSLDNPRIKAMEYGSYVKLYDYDLPTGLKSYIYKDLMLRLDLLIPGIGLPVKIFERRYEGDVVFYPGYIKGLTSKLDEVSSKLEFEPTGGRISVEGKPVYYTIYAFKNREEKKYYSTDSIIYTLSGQSHGFSSSSFLRGKVKLGFIADLVIVLVNCSELTRDQQTRLFLTSRDRLVKGDLKDELTSRLKQVLGNHKPLKEYQQRKYLERSSKAVKDDKILKETLQEIIRNSMLDDILTTGKVIHRPMNLQAATTAIEYRGKHSPDFFTLRKEFPEHRPKNLQYGSKARIHYETNVVDNYFVRQDNPGILEFKMLEPDEYTIEDFEIDLQFGVAKLSFSLDADITVDSIAKFQTTVADESLIIPHVSQFYIKIIPKQQTTPSSSTPRKSKPKVPGNGKEKTADQYGLPKVHEVEQGDWGEHDFTETSCAYADDDPEGGYIIYLNRDNIFIKGELKRIKNEAEQNLYKHFYKTAVVLFTLSMIKKITIAQKNNELTGLEKLFGEDVDLEDQTLDIRQFTRIVNDALAPSIIPVIKEIIKAKDEVQI